jgi:enterochelin esterase-like enzyme
MRRALGLIVTALTILLLWRLVGVSRQDRWAVPSKALRQTRHVLVHPPDVSNVGPHGFPILVLLDGGDQRQWSGERPLYSRSVATLSALESVGLPPVILVGVENRNRVEDMTPIERPDLYVGGGGAQTFIRYLETELVPFSEARWPVGQRRILYGESYGGLLVLDALARGGGVFTDYIAVSPAVGVWPDRLAAALRHRMAEGATTAPHGKTVDAPLNVFVVYGERDAPLVTEFIPPVIHLIATGRPPAWRLGAEVLPGAGHNPPDSLERGLRFVFELHQPERPPIR